jgi:hypothetical protein
MLKHKRALYGEVIIESRNLTMSMAMISAGRASPVLQSRLPTQGALNVVPGKDSPEDREGFDDL